MTPTAKETQEPRPYVSYLLRLWQAGDGGTKVWRASLESVQTRERTAFAGLEELFAFLREETRMGEADRVGRDCGKEVRMEEEELNAGRRAPVVDPITSREQRRKR